MPKSDKTTPEQATNEPFISRVRNWCEKNCNVILTAVCVIIFAIAGPVYWEFLQHREWGLLGVWSHVFSGSIDWSAWWTFGTFLVATITAIIALNEYHLHADESIEQSRAIMQIVYAKQDNKLFIVLENVGKTIAKDVAVKFTPTQNSKEEEDSAGMEHERRLFDKGALNKTISVIAPDVSMSYLVEFTDTKGKAEAKLDIPKKVIATITYKSYRGKKYTEEYTLNKDDWDNIETHFSDIGAAAFNLAGIRNELRQIRKTCNCHMNTTTPRGVSPRGV